MERQGDGLPGRFLPRRSFNFYSSLATPLLFSLALVLDFTAYTQLLSDQSHRTETWEKRFLSVGCVWTPPHLYHDPVDT